MHPRVGSLLQLDTETGFMDAVSSFLLCFCILLFGVILATTSLWVSWLSIYKAKFSVMTFDSAATSRVFSWAVFLITMFLLATEVTAVWWHNYLVQAFIVGGYSGSHLLVAVEDLLRPLGGLTGNSHDLAQPGDPAGAICLQSRL